MKTLIEQFVYESHVMYASQVNGEVFAHLIRNGIELLCVSRTGPIDSSLDALFRDFTETEIYMGPSAYAAFRMVMPRKGASSAGLEEHELYPIMDPDRNITIRKATRAEMEHLLNRARTLIGYYTSRLKEVSDDFDRSSKGLDETPAQTEPCFSEFEIDREAAAREVDRLFDTAVYDIPPIPADMDAPEPEPEEQDKTPSAPEAPARPAPEPFAHGSGHGIGADYEISLRVACSFEHLEAGTLLARLRPGQISTTSAATFDGTGLQWDTRILLSGIPAAQLSDILFDISQMVSNHSTGVELHVSNSVT